MATGFSALPLPGVPILGAPLLVAPDGLFLATALASAASAMSVTDVCSDGDYFCFSAGADGAADFVSPQFGGGSALHLDVPAAAVGLDLFSQGLVLHTATLEAFSTNRVRTSLLP